MQKQKAFKAWKNAYVITMNEECEHATAFASDKNGKLIYVGSDEDLSDYIDENTIVEDLNGHIVTPGFIEGHSHPSMYGQSLTALNVRDKSKEEILKMIEQAVQNIEHGKWLVTGMGFNNESWEDSSYPTKEDLDKVAPNNPVVVPRMDGHLIWVNSKALEVCGITKDTPNPEGGEFFRNTLNELQGCCANTAANIIRSKIPQETLEECKENLIAAQKSFLSKGITCITDMMTGFKEIEAVESLMATNEFKLRYYGCLFEFTGKKAGDKQREYLKEFPKIGLHNDRFTVRCCKFLGDGAVGAQSAHLNEPYTDRPGHTGVGMYTDEELYEAFKETADQGMQIAIHSIGDATVDQVLRTYRRLLGEKDYGDHRFRIEHFQTVTGNTPEQAAEMNIIPSMQPMHAPNSALMAIKRLGEERIHGAYAPGLVLKSTGIVALGSDAPVANPSPLSGIHAAVTRTNDMLEPKGGFCMENAITPIEAMKGYTTWGAYAMFAESKIGSIEVGKYTDFVIMSENPLLIGKSKPDDLLKIKVLATYINGDCVYKE